MKKRKVWLAVGLGVVLVGAVTLALVMNTDKSEATEDSAEEFVLPVAKTKNVQELDYQDLGITSYSDIYNEENQVAITEKVNALKEESDADFPNVLAISNPYLTNTTGLYVYFTTAEATKVSYQVSASGQEDFEATLYNPNGTYSTEHEYQLIGLVPEVENTITLSATTKDGVEETTTITYTPPKLQTTEQTSYQATDGKSTAELSDGLYAVIGDQGTDKRGTYLVDNDGVIRAEYPSIGYNVNRINFDDQHNMYLPVSKTQIAQINALGQVTKMYDLDEAGYELHHDLVLDDDNNLLVLATNQEDLESEDLLEDKIIKVDTQSGEVTSVADFRDLLPDLYEEATGLEEVTSYEGMWDPIHLNTIQYVGDDSIIVSSRETSTIMKLDNISEKAEISYFISDDSVWSGIGDYSDYLLTKDGDFTSQAGQHSVTYQKDENLPEGQYYLYMFNNNSALMDSRKDFDWANYPGTGTVDITEQDKSYYYKYLVDEESNSYQLVDQFEVPYSPLISSVQQVGENMLVDSGMQGTFTEYDSDHQAIRTFKVNSDKGFIYRVLKYDFNDFYFTAE
ncbi:MAG: aryl-sulfate sulfotransferase [Enterococcus sp.]